MIESRRTWYELILELAWAAGLFDGDGSTGTYVSAHRPNAVRIFMSVSQSADSNLVVPEVLQRFHTVVSGLGYVGAAYWDDRFGGSYLYQWKAGSFEEVQAIVALLWPELGAVKRTQAETALSTYRSQFVRVRARQRSPSRSRRLALPAIGTRPERREIDLAWAAGLFDAEGSTEIHVRRSSDRAHHSIRVRVSQAGAEGPPAVLIRFQRIVGCGWIEGPTSGKGYTNAYKWCAGALETVRVLTLLWRWLGLVKRSQAIDALRRLDELPVMRRHSWREDAALFLARITEDRPTTIQLTE
jgi:hypothetical protein